MDYIEIFSELRANNKYGRRSPHKAVLMLSVIELFEKNILKGNEIYYDEKLKSSYQTVWNRVMQNQSTLYSDAYIPFWCLQSDSFWHIIPYRGKEDVLSLMRNPDITPSETMLKDSVKYAELDEDLFFLMTLSSGRSSLKRVLLETYTSLSKWEIEKMAKSNDTIIDHSVSALSEYERSLTQIIEDGNENEDEYEVDNKLIKQFKNLNEDVQLVLNIAYFSFLKKHRNVRGLFKGFCPSVYHLLDKIINKPIRRGEISPFLSTEYEIFLSDLKISLMSEDGSLAIIEKIEGAINNLQNIKEDSSFIEEDEEIDDREWNKELNTNLLYYKPVIPRFAGECKHSRGELNSSNNEKEETSPVDSISTPFIIPEKDFSKEDKRSKYWSKEEEELITLYYNRGIDIPTLSEIVGRSETAVMYRLKKLGLIDFEQENKFNYSIDNKTVENNSIKGFRLKYSLGRSYIMNRSGVKVFSTNGYLKIIRGKLYRLNLKDECFSLKDMQFNGTIWVKGVKKIVSYPKSKLYEKLYCAEDYSNLVEDIKDCLAFEDCKVKVDGVWYDYRGNIILKNSTSLNDNPIKTVTTKGNDPLYENRKQALLRAMGFFRSPAKIKDIIRTISRSAWGKPIKENDVIEVIKTIPEIDVVDGKYILRK